MTLFEKALVLHLIGDWLLQNDWIARNKSDLRHSAAWLHAATHGVLLGLVFGWVGGVVLGVVHLIVDTRRPQRWWSRTFRQTQSGDVGIHVLIWGDQVMHIATIAAWMLLTPYLPL